MTKGTVRINKDVPCLATVSFYCKINTKLLANNTGK